MGSQLINIQASPRWLVQLVDLSILTTSFAFSYFVIKHFEFREIYRGHFVIYTGLFSLIVCLIFFIMRVHTGLIRYSNMQDVFRIFLALLVSSFIYTFTERIFVAGIYGIRSLDVFAVLTINFFIASSLLILLRTLIKEIFYVARSTVGVKKEQILIYGTDSEALYLKNALECAKNNKFRVVGFLDSRGKNKHFYIEQRKIFQLQDLLSVKAKYQVEKLLLLKEELGNEEKKKIIEHCIELGIKLITVPPPDQWVYGKLASNQIKELKVEDLLQRSPIQIDNASISAQLSGKRVLVTGAAGSIGSELVRQLINYGPQLLILCDQAESSLHELQLELNERFPERSISAFIGSVQNLRRMETLFKQHQPEIVFHAAAYKHVPMMEENPSEAVIVNVLGTKTVADLSILFKVERFVFVSTDKAVNPTNVMGASKRIAEIYVQSLNNFCMDTGEGHLNYTLLNNVDVKGGTRFITTRFGNVLGSSGSVLPRFRSQIQNGGPVTVTHPDITRYFMTIPEAVQLVLEAATMGKGGEIFVFDMGVPVRILDLASQMIRLAGLEPNKDIKIEFSGLRAGEKLYEELLNDEETTLPTHHEKIKIANVISKNITQVLGEVRELIGLCEDGDNMEIVKKMKEIVVEFISNNSRFECLDKSETDLYRKGNAVLVSGEFNALV